MIDDKSSIPMRDRELLIPVGGEADIAGYPNSKASSSSSAAAAHHHHHSGRESYSGEEELCCVYVPTNHLYIGDIFLINSKDVIRPNLPVREGIEIVVSVACQCRRYSQHWTPPTLENRTRSIRS